MADPLARDEVGSGRQSTTGPASPARRRARMLIGAGLAVVLVAATTVFLRSTAVGARWACERAGLACPVPFRVTADTESTGVVYVVNRALKALPAPPGGRDDCRGRASWAASLGGAAANATPVGIKVAAGPYAPVQVLGFSVHLDPPLAGLISQTGAAGPLLTCAHPGGAARGSAQSVHLDLDPVALGEQPDPSFAGGPAIVEAGATRSFPVTASTTLCHCRWRLEIALLVGRERRTVTVGPDGARAGTAADNPGQPSFETAASPPGSPYRFVEGKWRLDTAADGAMIGSGLPNAFEQGGGGTPTCAPLASATLPAMFGGSAPEPLTSTLVESTPAIEIADDVAGLRSLATFCRWRVEARAQAGPGYVSVQAYVLQSVSDARAELAGWLTSSTAPSSTACLPVLWDTTAPGKALRMTPVAGVGDDAAAVPGALFARAGNRAVSVIACLPAPVGAPLDAPRPPADPTVLTALARTALATNW
ncbi:hypothetical protein [Pseudofrankia sp. DC12]|uniref:hypothetical protein n=1 Tax=Pseudofrankia sp. DC12 TaxID=683315 RepID=UPI0012FAD318|nr:hypothetical protein [Pseudofrankia sp. DC12]